MDPENEDKAGEEAAAEPQKGATEATEATDPKPAAEGAEGAAEDGEELTDEHGHPAISKGKYERDIATKDAKIAELEKQIGEAAKTEAGRAALEKKIAELKDDQAEIRTDYELKLAGCTDEKKFKAAKKLVGDYEGDVDKLKADYPYLFADDKKKGSTGKKPEGAGGSDIDDKLDRAFGLK